MNPIRLYLLHFANINKFYDTIVDKKAELASRLPGCGGIKSRSLLNCLWRVMVLIEPFLSLIIITVYFPYFIWKVIVRGKKKTVGKEIALCYAGLAKQRIMAIPEIEEKIDYYLYPIFVDEKWMVPNKEKHSILERVSILDVIKAYLWSVLAIISATIKTHGKYLYRNHLSYEYILTNYFIQKVPIESTLYFVNHLDRWAVLFNYAPQQNKILLQHGIESPKADWPVKLSSVNKVYVLAESQKPRMVKAVLGHETEFVVMPPTITLTTMANAKKKNVVVVAGENYMYWEQEEYIIRNLDYSDLMVYVKIHPGKNDYQKYINLQKTVNPNIEVIKIQTFPKVEAVVSHNSTLGLEYEAHNIPVFYYDDMLLEDIVKHINAL